MFYSFGQGCLRALVIGVLATASANGQTYFRNIGRDPGGYDVKSPITRVVLMGVNDYTKVRPLRYCQSDAQLLSRALSRTKGGGTYFPISNPTRESIERAVPYQLKECRPQDTVLIFFSGHGFRDAKGNTYLAPVDCDPQNLTGSSIPLAFLRKELESCKASVKLLLLDACHAGGLKGAEQEMTTQDIEKDLSKAAGVYTIASCKADEQSWEWKEKQHGLFTYWLGRGLEGAADDNGDGVLTADEIYNFVFTHVPPTSERLGQRQTPVRIVGPDVPGVPVVLRLQPEKASVTLNRMAELLHEQALRKKVAKVGVLEFTSMVGNQELLGKLGPFGRTAADKMEQQLLALAKETYALADQRQIVNAMKTLKTEDLGDPLALRQLTEKIPRLDALLIGTFQRLAEPDRLKINCKLLSLPAGDVIASISGMAWVDEDLWALLGGSGTVVPQRGSSGGSGGRESVPPPSPSEDTQTKHPLLRPGFPFPLEVRSKATGKKLKLVADPKDPNKVYIAALPGEEFVIHVENRTKGRVLMRLLIDGVNTIVQRDADKDLSRVMLDEARGRILAPESKKSVAGWTMGVGQNAEVRRFKFVELSRSVAARVGFGEENIGLITAAFYEERKVFHMESPIVGSKPPKIGVGEGTKIKKKVKVVQFNPGKQIAAVTIHYLHKDALAEMK